VILKIRFYDLLSPDCRFALFVKCSYMDLKEAGGVLKIGLASEFYPLPFECSAIVVLSQQPQQPYFFHLLNFTPPFFIGLATLELGGSRHTLLLPLRVTFFT
jgi:hypothetical protein